MKKTINHYHIKNFFELDKFLFSSNGDIEPALYDKVMNGLKDINSLHFDNRNKDIDIFLKNLFNGINVLPNQDGYLSWFDLSEYKEMIDSVKKDRDRASTSALRDVKILKKPLEINNFTVFDQLEALVPNFTDVITYYRGAFAMNKTRSINDYRAPRPVLLLGEAGIGKTYFANTLASLLGTSYQFLDSNSISSSWALSGCSTFWKGADAGLIFKTLAPCETISPVITLDEIDKLQSNNQNSPFSLFHQMFEKENAQKFYDEFLRFSFDTSNIIYVLTANNIHNIPDSLLSRMEIFEVPNPNSEQMRNIIQNIYKKELNNSNFFRKKLDDEQLDKLISYKPREVQKILSSSINQHLSKNIDKLNKTNQKLEINVRTDIRKNIGF